MGVFDRLFEAVASQPDLEHRAKTMSIAMLERISGLASAEYNLPGTFYRD
jgi:hypothetical protein